MTESPSDETPWYAPGLHFACTQCGDCCTGEPGVVWVTAEEIAQIAAYRGCSLGEMRLFHTRLVGGRWSLREHANGDCVFFDGATRRCTIYPVRPTQCRTWPFWDCNLESPATWEQVQSRCPGAGKGGFVPLDEVRRRAAEVDV